MFRATHCGQTSTSSQQASESKRPMRHFALEQMCYWKIFTNVNTRISLLMHPPQHSSSGTHANIITHMHRPRLRWEEALNLQAYLSFLPTLALGFCYQSCPALPGLCNFQINKSLAAAAWGLISGCRGSFCLSVGVYSHSHHIHIKPHQQQLAGLCRLAALTVGD